MKEKSYLKVNSKSSLGQTKMNSIFTFEIEFTHLLKVIENTLWDML